MSKPVILFTTPVLHHPPAGGPALRIENSIKALSQVSELHVVSRLSKSEIGGEESENFYSNLCAKFTYVPSKQDSLLRKLARHRFQFRNKYVNRLLNLPFQVWSKVFGKFSEYLDAEFLIDYCYTNQIDVLWFGYGNISYDLMKTIKAKKSSIKIVCDTDSVWSRYILRELPFENNPKRKTKIKKMGKKKEEEEEAEWVNFCDVTTAVSEIDATYYRDLASDKKRIMLFSNVIDLDTYKIRPPKAKDMWNPCMYIAGSFWLNSPMEKSTKWVLNQVFPIVKSEIPDIHFFIIGRGSDTTLSDIKDKSVTITGMLDSVLPYLYYADVSIVPLTFESGTRFKILEAAACGIPIVSTTLGAEGINVTHGKDILIADDPQTFANSIVKLIKDKEYARSIALNCRDLIYENYSIKTLVSEAKKILTFLGVDK